MIAFVLDGTSDLAYHLIRNVKYNRYRKRSSIVYNIAQALGKLLHREQFEVLNPTISVHLRNRWMPGEKLEDSGFVLKERSFDAQRDPGLL